MYYGQAGLVNYDDETRKLIDIDRLEYMPLPPEGLKKKSTYITCLNHNLMALYHSIWRMVSKPAIKTIEPTLDRIGKHSRRLQVVTVNQLFPDFFDKPVWLSEFVLTAASQSLEKIGALSRTSGIRLVVIVDAKHPLSINQVKFLKALWTKLGYNPSSKHHSTIHRMYMHTSNLVGKSKDDKANSFKRFGSTANKVFALVGDDVSVSDTLKLCKEVGARATFNLSKASVKDSRIKVDDKAFLLMQQTWRDHKGSSSLQPVVYLSNKERNKEKLLNHYGRRSDVVFL